MKLWEKIAAGYIARRIRRQIMAMSPFPKWVGWFGGLGAVITAVGNGVKTGDWSGLAPAIGALIALFSHSATGTGGQPQ